MDQLTRYDLLDLFLPFLIAMLLALLALWLRLRQPGRPYLRVVIHCLLFYGIIECAVFQNPVFFKEAYRRLAVDFVGFRQRDVLEVEAARREKPWQAKYLAVGNSQTDAIYLPYVRDSSSTRLLTMAGMSPLELSLCREIIRRHCTNTVLLHLSEFDLSMEPKVEQLKLAPPQGPIDLWSLSLTLAQTADVTIWEILDLWAANYISPYRYSFVFKGALRRITAELQAFPGLRLSDRRGDFSRRQVDSLSQLSSQWFEANAKALDAFIAWCRTQGLKVVVVEGQYHPELYARNRELHAQAWNLVKEVCSRHPNSRLLTQNDLGTFTAADFRDGVHVVPAAGLRFARRVIEKLEQAERSLFRGSAEMQGVRRL